MALPPAAGRQDADPARAAHAAHVAGRVGGHPRVAPPPEDLPRQSPAGLHAHVAGLRLVSPDLGGLDRDGGLPRVPLRAPAGSRLLQVFRHGTRTQARLRPPDGPAAALCPLGRGPGLGQAFLLAGNGHAPHDETRPGRPHRPVGPVVHLPGTPAGREHDLRVVRRRELPDRFARRMDGGTRRRAAADEPRVGCLVVLLLLPRALLRGVAFLALHAHLHRDPAHLPAPLPAAFGREGDLVRPFPGRGLLALRHLHRPLPAAERARHPHRAVGLFPA